MADALSDSRPYSPQPHGAPSDATQDVQLAWSGGLIHLRSVPAGGCSERQFVRRELAIGICFLQRCSAVRWRVDGDVVLEKCGPSSGGARELVILPAGHELSGHWRGPCQDLWLFLQPQVLPDSAPVRSFTERPRVEGSWAHDPVSWAIAKELRNECLRGFPRGPVFLQSAATVLLTSLAYILERLPDAEPARTLSEPKLARVLDYIQQHLDRNITLAELAALVELTPRYFCELFRRTTGRPPHQFQIEQRIERAKSLLERPGLPLREVALMAGFSSQSHLNVYFRRIAGMTPARYRAQRCSLGTTENRSLPVKAAGRSLA